MEQTKNNKKIGQPETHTDEGVRRGLLYGRTFTLLDRLLFQKLFLRGVLGGFDAVVRLFATSGDSAWPATAHETQERILETIVRKNSTTIFAKEHRLHSDTTYSEFRKNVPIFSYEEIFPYIERMLNGEKNVLTSLPVTEYAKSSGTTNSKSKYIPTPSVYMKGNHLKGSYDMISFYSRAHPHTNIFSGKAITITGSYSPIPGSIFKAGDVSALMFNATPWWTAGARPYKKSLALQPSWAHKAEEIVDASLDANIVLLGGTPTWMIEILELAQKKSAKKTLQELWPNLEVFFHGAVAFGPYRKTVEALIGKESFEFREVYNASEGFFAFEDEPKKHPSEMLLCTDHDIFYEFVSVQDCIAIGEAIPLFETVPNKPYAMVITTVGGLWRYRIGDVVMFTSTNPYRLKIVGRTTHFMNAFGEEVVANNAVGAIKDASDVTGAEVQAFTVAPTFNAKPSHGAHEWAIEFRTDPKDLAAFAAALDTALRDRNSDYDSKRTGDIILGQPIIHAVPKGTFRSFMENRGKLGAQNKVPVLSDDRKNLEAILKII